MDQVSGNFGFWQSWFCELENTAQEGSVLDGGALSSYLKFNFSPKNEYFNGLVTENANSKFADERDGCQFKVSPLEGNSDSTKET